MGLRQRLLQGFMKFIQNISKLSKVNWYEWINIIFFFDMNDIGYEEISVVVENNEQVAIFDKDNWKQQNESICQGDNQHSLKLIKDQDQPLEDDRMKRISKQLQDSKENFFRFNVSNNETVKKKELSSQNTKNKLASISSKKSNSVLKEGIISKKTDGLIFQWHRRYMVLTSEKVFFFSDQYKCEMIGCINLKLLRVEIKEKGETLIFDFLGENQNIIVKFDSKKQQIQWKSWLEKVVGFNNKQLKLKIKTMAKPFYIQKDCLTENQFIKQAQTGDILLFYTRNNAAKVQRFFTNSQFDHVAMVVKLGNREPMVFESNPSYGVCMFKWNQFLYYFNLYEKVTLRKLNYLRKPEAQQSIIEFAKRNMGKKYDIGALKMLKLESDFNWEKLKQEEQNSQARGYFCSQLIAKAYKSVGLIESKKSSARYWPVDFCEKSGLMLKKNAWLGPQISIVLDKHIKRMI